MQVLKNIISENRLNKIRLLEPEHFVVGGQPSGIWEEPNDNNAHYDLACVAKYTLEKVDTNFQQISELKQESIQNNTQILDYLKLAMPVGLLANSIDQKPFNHMWLNLNGEGIDNDTYPVLYQYLLNIGYSPEEKEGKLAIKLPDARGLVFRSQNKSRFKGKEVEEIPLGGYQADATQKVFGKINSFSSVKKMEDMKLDGPFYVVEMIGNGVPSQGEIGHTDMHFAFDNNRVARTAFEERVKALGVNAQIFVGFK